LKGHASATAVTWVGTLHTLCTAPNGKVSTVIAAQAHKVSRKFIGSLFKCDPPIERWMTKDAQALTGRQGDGCPGGEYVVMRPYAHCRGSTTGRAACSGSPRPGR